MAQVQTDFLAHCFFFGKKRDMDDTVADFLLTGTWNLCLRRKVFYSF